MSQHCSCHVLLYYFTALVCIVAALPTFNIKQSFPQVNFPEATSSAAAVKLSSPQYGTTLYIYGGRNSGGFSNNLYEFRFGA